MSDIKKLKYWAQKILPLVYDDSLSYYEVLGKVSSKLNEVIQDVNNINIESNPELAFDNIYFIDTINNLTQFANTTTKGLLVVNNGKTNTVAEGTTFNSGLAIVFITGMLAGTNLTVNSKIYAERKQIFSDDTINTLTINNNNIGFPEWFGCNINNSNTPDRNKTGIQYCLDNFPVTSLDYGNYYSTSGLTINKSYHSLIGNKSVASADGSGSKIIIVDNDNIALTVGDGTAKGITTIYLQNFSIISNNATTASVGALFDGVRNLQADRLVIADFAIDYDIGYMTISYFTRCRGLYNKQPNFTADNIGASVRVITKDLTGSGYIASTASVYFIDCSLQYEGTRNQYTYGFYISGNNNFADFMIANCNFARCSNGIYINCTSASLLQQDIKIINNVIDNTIDGIHLIGNYTAEIENNFISSTSEITTVTRHCAYFQNTTNQNNIIFANNVLKGTKADVNNNTYGLRIANSYGINVTNVAIVNFSHPIAISNSFNIYVQGNVRNDSRDVTEDAAYVETSSNSVNIDIGLSGSHKYARGVYITESCTHCQVNPTRLIATNLTGVRVRLGDVDVTNANCFTPDKQSNTVVGSVS